MEVFDVAPLGAGATVAGILIAALCLGLAALFAYMVFGSRRVRYLVDGDSLRVVAPFYGRRIPFAALDLAGGRALDLNAVPELAPRSFGRTNGLGLPGLKLGWYKLQSGGKALLFVTDPSRAVHLPVKQGYDLIMSVDEPERLLQRLREVAA